EALASDAQNFGSAHPTVAIRQSNLALVYQDLGRYAEAAGLLEEALASDAQNFGSAHPTVAIRQSNLALVYKDLSRYAEAIPLLFSALQLFTDVLGENHPNVDTVGGNLMQTIEQGAAAGDAYCMELKKKMED
ncbi:MAG: tetratricopeptide repeat protein, partial [Bacteroidota bacterium]